MIVEFLRPASIEGCDYVPGQKISFGEQYADVITAWQETGPIVKFADGGGIVTSHNPMPPYSEAYVDPAVEFGESTPEISSTEPTDG